MELLLLRSYYPEGTNGEIWCDGEIICLSIELPELRNIPYKSCIPEGRYEIVRRFTPQRGYHLHIKKVEGRTLILFHKANEAKRDLQGCIGPVLSHTGPGKGSNSAPALVRLERKVFRAIDRNEKVFITIKSK